MIIIISHSIDESTNSVLEWIEYFGINSLRINIDRPFQHNSREEEILSQAVNGEIQFILWTRTNNNPFKRNNFASEEQNVRKHLYAENVMSVIYMLTRNAAYKLGMDFSANVFIKLNCLEIANECGLTVPNYVITNTKARLTAFLKEHKRVITKCFFETFTIKIGKTFYKSYTIEVSQDKIDTLKDAFGFSFFQKLVEKKFDLKIAYLDGVMFPVGIRVTNKAYDCIDYRNYNESRIRMFSIDISAALKEQISRLMDRLRLNFGVLDFIIDPSGNYHFLEINPYGQFNDLSSCYDFQIEKQIALWLMRKQNQIGIYK